MTHMEVTSVTSKGWVTLAKKVRQQLGIWQSSRIRFAVVSDHIEIGVKNSPSEITKSGFGKLKSRRPSVPVDFDVATLQIK